MIIEYIPKIVLLLALAAAAYSDCRRMSISLIFILSLFITGAAFQIISGNLGVIDLIAGCCVGIILLAIAFASGRSMGPADALMFIASGSFLGFTDNLKLLLISLGICGIASICLMIFAKLKGINRIPFLPFMFSGYICLLAF